MCIQVQVEEWGGIKISQCKKTTNSRVQILDLAEKQNKCTIKSYRSDYSRSLSCKNLSNLKHIRKQKILRAKFQPQGPHPQLHTSPTNSKAPKQSSTQPYQTSNEEKNRK